MKKAIQTTLDAGSVSCLAPLPWLRAMADDGREATKRCRLGSKQPQVDPALSQGGTTPALSQGGPTPALSQGGPTPARGQDGANLALSHDLVTVEAKKVLAMSKGRIRVPLTDLGPALFNRRGAATCGRHCHDLGKRILSVEGFATYRYTAGWCHEPDPDDPLAVARHGNAMAAKDRYLPKLPMKPLKGVFAKTHLVTFLQLLQTGGHKWAGSDEAMVAPASSQEGQASSQEELADVLRDGIFMHVFPYAAVRDHYDAIVALMASDNFDHAHGLVESEVRCLLQVRDAIHDIPVPVGGSQFEAVLCHVTRLGAKWSVEDVQNFWNFSQTTGPQQMDFMAKVWTFADCESVLRVESRFFGNLAKVPAVLQWHRVCLAVAHFLSDREAECSFIGGKHVAGAIRQSHMKAITELHKSAPASSQGNEAFIRQVFTAYYHDLPRTPAFTGVGADAFLKPLAAFADRAGRMLGAGNAMKTEQRAKLERKVRSALGPLGKTTSHSVLPDPIEPEPALSHEEGRKCAASGPSVITAPVLEEGSNGEVNVSFKRRAQDAGVTEGALVTVAGTCGDQGLVKGFVDDVVLVAFGDEEARALSQAPTTRVDLASLTVVPVLKKRKPAAQLPDGIKWASCDDAECTSICRQMAHVALYELYLSVSAGHADLRLVDPEEWTAMTPLASSQDSPAAASGQEASLQVVTARFIKKGALAILPFGPSLVSAGGVRPRGSTGVTLVIGGTNGRDELTSFWLKAKTCPTPSEVSLRPREATAVVPFWLLASQPETPADTDKTSALLVYRQVVAKIPCASQIEDDLALSHGSKGVPCWRSSGVRPQISVRLTIMTNDRDIPAATRLCIGNSPP